MADQHVTVDDLNTKDAEKLTSKLGHLFERSPWIVKGTLACRPFSSARSFHEALCTTVRHADTDAQLALIREHPDLVGTAAMGGTLTPSSAAEQVAAGLDSGTLTETERAAFLTFNEDYRARFGFPFVICARENRKMSILRGFETRLQNDRETEIATAIAEIEKIAWYRLAEIMPEASEREDGGEAGAT